MRSDQPLTIRKVIAIELSALPSVPRPPIPAIPDGTKKATPVAIAVKAVPPYKREYPFPIRPIASAPAMLVNELLGPSVPKTLAAKKLTVDTRHISTN